MKSTNHVFEVAYTEQELEAKVEGMKSHGYAKNNIHVLAENADILNAIETQEEVQTHETEIEEFHDILENEGIVLYAEQQAHGQ
ncbi:hypothetical protein BBI15_07785 [Planococcus plakortidis]|uniref:Uncharacterized protein n=1 Tax=Planococcus plakortidis TaxID=1038856 RepID=A0A1C7E8D3_9BACL|nr:general stress protein [Planococcus plakortidis]ANU20120.1 hypothetical protein BBI15_07785 [Planococcus plakortidis]